MNNSSIRDDQWTKIYEFLSRHPNVYAGKEEPCRLFVEAVHWIVRSGAQWRMLPENYGYWNSVYKRFSRWCDNDVFESMHIHFANDPDMENILLDSTIVRAHPCAAGASKKVEGKQPKR